MRFLPPVAALADGAVFFDGDPHARKRPMAPLLARLRALGAEVDGVARCRSPSRPGRLAGGGVSSTPPASSQFVSGLLLAAARFDKGLWCGTTAPPLPSRRTSR